MSRWTACNWLLRTPLVLLWAAVFVWTTSWTMISEADLARTLYAAFQTLTLIAYFLTVTLVFLASRRGELFAPGCILVLGLVLHAAAAISLGLPIPPALGPWADLMILPHPATMAALVGSAVLGAALIACTAVMLPGSELGLTPRQHLRAIGRGVFVELSPLRLLFGPVFQKEVRITGRRRFTYITRAGFAVLLLLITSLAYFGMVAELSHYGGAERIQRLQGLAPQLAVVIGWAQLLLLAFLAPILTSPAICDERRALTLPALMTTPMSAGQIIAGKLTSRLVLLLLLALIPAPLLLAARIFGGLDAEPVIAMTAMSLSFAVLGASLGLMYSIWHKRAATAAIFAMLTIGLLVLAGGVTLGILAIGTAGVLNPAWGAIASPVAMGCITVLIFDPQGFPVAPGVNALRVIWITNTVLNLGLAAGVCLFSTAMLRRVLRAEAAGEGRLSGEGRPRRMRRRGRAEAPATAPEAPAGETSQQVDAATSAAHSRTVTDRPVLWREIRQHAYGGRRRFLIIAGVIAAAFLWLYWQLSPVDELVHFSIVLGGLFVLVLQSSLASTAAIAGERESRSLDVLLTTSLGPMEILAGKLAGALRRLWLPVACIAFHLALVTVLTEVRPIGGRRITDAIAPLTMAHLALVLLPFPFFLVCTGLLASVIFRRSTAAAVGNMGLALGICFCLPLASGLLVDIFNLERSASASLLDGLFLVNPFVTAAVALDAGPGTPRYEFPFDSYTAPQFTRILAVVAAVYTVLGIAAVLLARRLFRRTAR